VGARRSSYPLALYPYTSTPGPSPVPTDLCAGFIYDPATCSGAVGSDPCYVAWDANTRPDFNFFASPCTFWRLVADPTTQFPPIPGPTMEVLKRNDRDDKNHHGGKHHEHKRGSEEFRKKPHCEKPKQDHDDNGNGHK